MFFYYFYHSYFTQHRILHQAVERHAAKWFLRPQVKRINQ
jgi:hypothetical protein